MAQVSIHHRFSGPPTSGNGGYTSGLLGKLIDGPAEVTLRTPPPLDKPMTVQHDGDMVKLMDGDVLVAEAKPAALDIQLPEPLTLAQAQEASRNFVGFSEHYFSTCFVCGTGREEGDGMRIFAGSAGDLVASPWQPEASLADESGNVAPEFIWAVLDCPGFFAAFNGKQSQRALLGRMTADIHGKVEVGKNYIVIGWPEQAEGRKHIVGTALYQEDGTLVAAARGVWIVV